MTHARAHSGPCIYCEHGPYCLTCPPPPVVEDDAPVCSRHREEITRSEIAADPYYSGGAVFGGRCVMTTPGEDPAVTLTSADPQPPCGTVVRDDCGITWKRDYGEGYWLRVDRPDGDPESWAKIAGNYGPVTVLSPTPDEPAA